ncbi:A/G-specific adenine glycosylase [Variovorax dokdonensis]|uniref:Adenine DNA glycosylase n=1 Tax=Variovorax dokdonensis TaxID=344883 RepID=A0ABT7N5V5_9BURK|nr:A/G-specific adenine glycosylase [Variovorax dokdonensis]
MSDFSSRVVRWQASHGRSTLPWQNTRDPYRVWLSEIMLQQTQVSTVLGYFDRFLARFPSVAELARADEDEVLGLWSGLGYYSRARNMHRCAREVMARFDGAFPRTAVELATLPGIGRSTAAAIAAFCFGERVAILDGNVKRVLARWLGFDEDLASSTHEKALWNLATGLLPPADRPADIASYTQGLMDLGATVCTPRGPLCEACPVRLDCVARERGWQARLPVKTRKLKRTSQSLWLLLARDGNGRVWLEKRPSKGIWAGLHALPAFDSREALVAAMAESGTGGEMHDVPAFRHVLTHKDLHLHPVLCDVPGDRAACLSIGGTWADEKMWVGLGLPTPVRRLLTEFATRMP